MKVSREDFDDLAREHRVLIHQYGRAQSRCSELVATQAEQIRQLQSQVMQLRAAVIVRDTALAFAREDHAAIEMAIPGLPKRVLLARQVEMLTQRIEMLMRERVQKEADLPIAAEHIMPADLNEKSVLCVGQDAMDMSATRQMIEKAGGRYLHHDGCNADNEEALEASLVGADLVICQTGCISHNAYWRVKDHCKRTGKQCVLIDQPQAINFVRDLPEIYIC